MDSDMFSVNSKVSRYFQEQTLRGLKGQSRKRTLQEHHFGRPFPRTTPSSLLWHALKKSRSKKYQKILWIQGIREGIASEIAVIRIAASSSRKRVGFQIASDFGVWVFSDEKWNSTSLQCICPCYREFRYTEVPSSHSVPLPAFKAYWGATGPLQLYYPTSPNPPPSTWCGPTWPDFRSECWRGLFRKGGGSFSYWKPQELWKETTRWTFETTPFSIL